MMCDCLLTGFLTRKRKKRSPSRSAGLSRCWIAPRRQARRYRLYRRLAELYWELNFQDLVQGDIRKLALERGSFYVDRALSERPDDAGMWLLRGRILLTDEEPGAR